jgi:hypothetical protein
MDARKIEEFYYVQLDIIAATQEGRVDNRGWQELNKIAGRRLAGRDYTSGDTNLEGS